mmetsp:Transcript_1747/g.4674  ORF Transcript_1747/g.4674 Transcript_1747/m.4674 type:complete len:217 (+) Transcript_1747:186-836(+)
MLQPLKLEVGYKHVPCSRCDGGGEAPCHEHARAGLHLGKLRAAALPRRLARQLTNGPVHRGQDPRHRRRLQLPSWRSLRPKQHWARRHVDHDKVVAADPGGGRAALVVRIAVEVVGFVHAEAHAGVVALLDHLEQVLVDLSVASALLALHHWRHAPLEGIEHKDGHTAAAELRAQHLVGFCRWERHASATVCLQQDVEEQVLHLAVRLNVEHTHRF